MKLPPGRLLVIPVVLAVLGTPLSAQGSADWASCRMDSLATFNCARYYSGTVSLTSELRGTNLRQTYRVVATITLGQVRCQVNGTEVGAFEGPGMLVVEHASNMNSGGYGISVWCPDSAGTRPTRRNTPLIMVRDQRSANYAVLGGRDAHEHPDTDAANGLSGTETITWDLRRP